MQRKRRCHECHCDTTVASQMLLEVRHSPQYTQSREIFHQRQHVTEIPKLEQKSSRQRYFTPVSTWTEPVASVILRQIEGGKVLRKLKGRTKEECLIVAQIAAYLNASKTVSPRFQKMDVHNLRYSSALVLLTQTTEAQRRGEVE
ncbi:hypothetical protein KIL84_003805 [Mauremys mutica]|uniref:Uncharacterized protein n=1 Tax=Mauremys mutica TaxID=74926 RepID=A0A9D3WUI3_9SAUR|nr:hypothetical protein KIL84_003805 [Mauremys mutica]